ncbi:hypothetical protein Q5424_12335 [Conexibacter sp. JD483]|uniref:hypothetical protein n=1 Tax=unclassified Conexibacter TaxID=2627773 RepID=UPI00271636D3|nr:MULTISPECIES: hypothetical protein [unclassified Conexibacter]MDO8187466.1 hypothetical protein [Conexibacter sp. CPCC 205706]MDO8198700.1 hypothetical protein [Conexibacter sp. CPCC 205762]MDR9369878.1 hypothetical protein [Conexibacter sp. JD483]
MNAADALAELRLRREQIAAEHARPRPRWRLPLSMALAFGGHAVRELEGRPVQRPLSLALTVVNVAEMLPAPGERRVAPTVLWLQQTQPLGATDASAPEPPPAGGDDRLLPPAGADPRGAGTALVALLLASSVLPRWLVPRLERRGVRHPQLVTGTVAALVVVPLAEIVKRRVQRGVDPASALPDVSAAASFPAGFEPRPAQAPLLFDPALLSLTGLLAPAGGVSRSLLRELLALDAETLAGQLRALDTAGWVEPSGRGWRDPQVGLTPAGRAAVAGHAAWLRVQAAPA